MLSKMFDGIK